MERSEARKAACKAACKKLYYERKSWNVCTVCGKPKLQGETTVLCAACLKKRAAYREETRSRIRELDNARRRRYREQGLCIFCGTPTESGKYRCEYHRQYQNERQRARKRGTTKQ